MLGRRRIGVGGCRDVLWMAVKGPELVTCLSVFVVSLDCISCIRSARRQDLEFEKAAMRGGEGDAHRIYRDRALMCYVGGGGTPVGIIC